MRKLIGLDIETYDPLLKAHGKNKACGWSWKHGEGYILCTAVYDMSEDTTNVYAGIHNSNSPYTIEERLEQNMKIKALLQNPDVSLVGANIQYDIGWLLKEFSMSTFDVKCRFIDVLQAEHILNEFDKAISLENVSRKYLNFGKTKDRIESWVKDTIVEAKGDFRGYLKEAPYDLLVEYVTGDAKNPCLVWTKQLVELKKQDLCERCLLEFQMILPTLQMTINGMPFNKEKKDKLCKQFENYIQKYSTVFEERFGSLFPVGFFGKSGIKNFKPTSTKQIATICSHLHIPYRDKITLKGYQGKLFSNYIDTDLAMKKVKLLVSSFRFMKSIPVAYVPHEMTDRTCDLLRENGFMFTCNPNCDKKFFESQRDNYEIIDVIANWKVSLGILSKILGEEYSRFICKDNRVRPQFNITDTVSFRYSSCSPNCQQIPSKNGIVIAEKDAKELNQSSPELAECIVYNEDKKEYTISFPAMTRALFTAEQGKSYFKIDYGQIEYRLICNIAVGEGSKEVREEFERNPRLDFHQYVVNLTGLSRKLAKNMSFGVSFGMGLASMCENFGWTKERGEEISEKYHQHMPFVAPTLELVGDVAKKRGYIKTVLGSHARLPNPNKSYTMLNRYTQGSGAEILKMSIHKAYEEGLWKDLQFHVTVHDELGFSVAPVEEEVRKAFRMSEIMTTAVNLKVPLIADIELGDDWYNVHEIPEWFELKEKNDIAWIKASEATKKNVLLCKKIMEEKK